MCVCVWGGGGGGPWEWASIKMIMVDSPGEF